MAKLNQIYSQAGILGITPNTNMGGLKVEPKVAAATFLAIILFIKVIGIFLKKMS
ncbi:MAG: hypothetical protein N3D10_01745 [Candidatus Micrarchaeota archaeon]|nr:hypothetical protein [Candidatus Micrarchaeota archaeon]